MTQRVIVLAGHRRSLSSLAMVWALWQLRRQGVVLEAVVCVSEFSWKRLNRWYRRFGSRLAVRVLCELGLARSETWNDEFAVYRSRLDEWNVRFTSLPRLCGALGIPFHVVRDVNGAASADIVKRLQADFAIYSGAGILRQPLIESVRQGVLNLHCGPLPHVRGMNGVEWSLYLGLVPEVTLHYIDAGIDTGKILASRRVDVARGEKLGRLRGHVVMRGIDLLAEVLPEIHALTPLENPIEGGRQYFAMSEPLRQLVQQWLAEGRTPLCPASEVDPNDLRPAPHRRAA